MERITYSRKWESQMKNEAIYVLTTTGMKNAAKSLFPQPHFTALI
jgi:hypothetical protein